MKVAKKIIQILIGIGLIIVSQTIANEKDGSFIILLSGVMIIVLTIIGNTRNQGSG